jgi:hypothetical protein
MVKSKGAHAMLKYIELKSGHNDRGPAWIAHVKQSKSQRTVYFNGRALGRLSGRHNGGNHIDIESREIFWVSGIKKDGCDRHWAGGGVVHVERAAVEEYLQIIGETELDKSKYRITDDVVPTDISRFTRIENLPLETKV